MESKVRKRSDNDSQERHGSNSKHYTMNIQRIFQNESNFKFRQLENYEEAEDRELLSPEDTEQEDLLGLGTLSFIHETRYVYQLIIVVI